MPSGITPHDLVGFVRDLYGTTGPVPLHAPTFTGNEKAYVDDTIDSTFVSSVGAYVDRFEAALVDLTGAGAAVAVTNGTAALSVALHVAGVGAGDLVVTQPLSFVATCNAIHHLGAAPVFVDVERVSLSMSPDSLQDWLVENAEFDGATTRHRRTGRTVGAVVPMHTFGHPARLDEIADVSRRWGLTLVEDAAESLGSYYKGRHTGSIGEFGTLSFNGNKTVTTGGGGAVLTRDADVGRHVKHLTTTAKVPHAFDYVHDEAGFNHRMPNLNAALGVAQLERLQDKLFDKREIAGAYAGFFAGSGLEFVVEPEYGRSNYWLNAVLCTDRAERDRYLVETNAAGVMTRPAWELMHRLPMYAAALRGDLPVAEGLADRLVNLPSTPRGV